MTARPKFDRLILNAREDVLRVVTTGGMVLEFEISPEDMSALSRWSFARKIFHILMSTRTVEIDPSVPITH